MRVQGASDYALRALIELAGQEDEGLLSAEQIGALQGIPTHFLLRILADLSRAGLVTGVRGHAGGWRLARDPATVNVAEVLEAVNGPLVQVQGLRPEELEYNPTAAPLRLVWLAARDSLRRALEDISIAQLADRVQA